MLTGNCADRGPHPVPRRDVTGANPHEIARLGVGIKTQVPNVFNGLTVAENVAIGAGRRKSIQRAAASPPAPWPAAVGGHRPPHRWAVGARPAAVVEIATVLAQEPDLILLDEPAAGMTHEEVLRTADLIRDINRTRRWWWWSTTCSSSA